MRSPSITKAIKVDQNNDPSWSHYRDLVISQGRICVVQAKAGIWGQERYIFIELVIPPI